MDVMRAIEERRSIRSYEERDVEEVKLKAILEAARLAPSASNRQEWKFIVVRDKGIREKLSRAACDQAFVAEAAVVIVACAMETSHVMRCGQLSYPIDVAIAIEHMVLKAVEEGLGTCWIGAFYEDQIKEILGIPKETRVVELLTLGYPKEAPKPKSRKSLREIVLYERWAD